MMGLTKMTNVFLIFVFFWVGELCAELLYAEDEPGAGVEIYPLSSLRWRSKPMTCSGSNGETDFKQVGPDFFEKEFGIPCDFATGKDFIKAEGYCLGVGAAYELNAEGMLIPKVPGSISIGFGSYPGKITTPQRRLEAFWGAYEDLPYELQVTYSQDAPASQWRFSVNGKNGVHPRLQKDFTLKGASGIVTQKVFLGTIRDLFRFGPTQGFRLTCISNGSSLLLKQIKIYPASSSVVYRKTFELLAKPVKAHCDLFEGAYGELVVNGRIVSAGNRITPAGNARNVDLTDSLKVGRNVICYSNYAYFWYGAATACIFEGMAVDETGAITRITAPDGWRCALNPDGDWRSVDYDDTTWKKAEEGSSMHYTTTVLAGGKQVSKGINPTHMGLLSVKPCKREYPLFDMDETVAYQIELAGGVAYGRVRVEIANREAKAPPELCEYVLGCALNGISVTEVVLPKLEPGAYKLTWCLLDKSGGMLDETTTEAIIPGPIAQEFVPLADFEEMFEKKLELVQRIDCTQPSPGAGEFLDHSGMYQPAKINKGGINTNAAGLKYRETGKDCWDYFAYRIRLKERGVPYLVEIVVPDDDVRYIYSGVLENRPMIFCGQAIPCELGFYCATGTCTTGGRYPLTGGKRILRYIYYPTCDNAAVAVMSGLKDSPAAACEINIYRIIGDLPALKIPKTDRMFGSFNERISTMILNMACEGPLEQDPQIRVNGHDDAWYHWYMAIKRKIKWLRFQGRNMTVEGVYMYREGDYPSLKHNRFCSNKGIDPAFLAIKMYERNSIHCLLGFQYMASPQLRASGRPLRIGMSSQPSAVPPLFLVDRYGKTVIGKSESGLNFLAQENKEMFFDTLTEIYDRYSGAGHVDGLFMTSGAWWFPGFINAGIWSLESLDIGYDDFTVGLFEKETALNLGISQDDPGKYGKRYLLLTNEHRAAWLKWRENKLKSFMLEISKAIQAKKNKWHLYFYPIAYNKKDNPFKKQSATAAPKDQYVVESLTEAAFPIDSYKNEKNITMVAPLYNIPTISSRTKEAFEVDRNWVCDYNFNSGTLAVVKALNAVIPYGSLNEVDSPATAAEKWLWEKGIRGCFVLRGIEDNCMDECVNIIKNHTPKVFFYSWIDCQLETAFGEQIRRFCEAFYATPEIPFSPVKSVAGQGIVAQVGNDGEATCLRLVNDTPLSMRYTITSSAKRLHDRVYDKTLAGKNGGGALVLSTDISQSVGYNYEVTLLPFDIRIYSTEAAGDTFQISSTTNPAVIGPKGN